MYRKATVAFVLLMVVATVAYAGTFGTIKDLLTGGNIIVGVFGVVVMYVLKKIPNTKIKGFFRGLCKGLGVAITLGMSKWPLTATLWNKTIEAYFIDLIDNVVGGSLEGLIEGLKTDNK
ncbi:MAG TPA: hypothetical protein ENH82_15015 [bacterium]|nr:hypothetical protein [bacterium]